MRNNLNKHYIAGWIDGKGCFAIHRRGDNYSVYFKMCCDKENKLLTDSIFAHLKRNLGIGYRSYKQKANYSFYVAKNNSFVKLIEFFKESCFRQDYLEDSLIIVVKKRYDKFNAHNKKKVVYPWSDANEKKAL